MNASSHRSSFFRRRLRCACLGLVLAVSATGCSESTGERHDARRELLRAWGQDIFIPNYRKFETSAADLDRTVTSFCDSPGEETLEVARTTWAKARAPWKRNDLLAFGPYTDQPLRFGPKIDFWPARIESIAEVLSADGPADSDAVNAMGANQKGFPVIEYLLFEPDVDIVAESGDSSRRCEYLEGLTADLAEQASGIREAWDPAGGDYLSELVDAGRTSEAYATIDMALGEIVNRLIFTVEDVRGERLGNPLGNRSGGDAQPDAVESRFSGRSMDDARDALRGVEMVCFGTGDGKNALVSYLERIQHPEIGPALRKAFDESYDALDSISEPLTLAVTEDPDSVQHAIDVLSRLQRLLQVDVINSMGLTLTFNDNDGD